MALVFVVVGQLLIPALLTSQPLWTIYAAWMWALLGGAVIISNHWPVIVRRVLEFSGPALAALCIFQRFSGRVSWPYNGNATASALLLLLPWWWGKDWLVVWICLVGLGATGSAGAMLSAIVAVAMLITHSYATEKCRPYWPYALIIIGAAMIAGVVIAQLQPATSAARLAHWKTALSLMSDRPLTGWGPGSYPAVSAIPEQNHADNLLLTIGAEMGLLGFDLVMVAVAVVLIKVFTTSGNPARMALLSWLLHNLVDCTLYFPLVTVLVAANIVLLWRSHDRNPGDGTPKSIGGVGHISRSPVESQ